MRHAELLLIGERPNYALNQHVQRRGLTDSVTFIPYVEANELRPLLQSLDLFVIPSHQEGLCIAALEAMACGVPVISTRCGGPEEFVVDGETGFLAPGEPDGLAEVIARVLGDGALRSRLSHGAQRAIQTHYHPDAAKSRFWQAFEATFD